jgi:2-polyprenyl-3-methyl-5-hydroxy-6-metoxy-1,4-benzoquinol methylase
VRYGFRIEEYFDLEGWKVVDLADVPMAQVAACPADETPLTPICTLTSTEGAMRVRVGCCPECGHISYMDRPTREWVYRYYLDTWDSASGRRSSEGMAATADKAARAADATVHATVRLAQGLPLDRTLPVCEIGCGYGTSLHQLAASGFTRLVGIEASRHRAEITASAGFDVLTTPFEAPETREALRRRGPFGLIFTFHALEHTYHPDRVFAAASELQEPGGHLIVSVPNQEGEPSMGVLMFLPHLHSFTEASLARLAARFGYEVAETSANTAKTLNMVFTRADPSTVLGAGPSTVLGAGPSTVLGAGPSTALGAGRALRVPVEERPYERAVEKLVSGLDLEARHVGRRRLWWSRRSDIAGQVWVGPPASIGRRNWNRFVERGEIHHPRSVLVSSLRPGRSAAPLEIQFRGSVGLFFK